MPAPAVPTIALANITSNGNSVTVTNTDSVTRNEVWRKGSDESEYVRLTRTLAEDGVFSDYGVRSGFSYSYFARAVNASGETDSLISAITLTLTNCWLHMIDKTQAATQLSGSLLSATNLEGQTRGGQRRGTVYICGGRTVPVVLTSEIIEHSLQVPFVFTSDADLASLQTIFEARRVVCLRDQKGFRIFGSISDLPIEYRLRDQTTGDIISAVAVSVDEMSFSEQVDA